jgi:hypothetical protein
MDHSAFGRRLQAAECEDPRVDAERRKAVARKAIVGGAPAL